MSFDSPSPFSKDETIAQVLLTPTRIYVKQCLAAIRAFPTAIKGFAHITGGGLPENLPRVLPNNLCAKIDSKSWELPPVFAWLKKAGNLDAHDFLRTFNCGIGMVVIVEKVEAESITAFLTKAGEKVYKSAHLPHAQATPWRSYKTKALFVAKDFDSWNIKKKKSNDTHIRPMFKEREVWWCSLGINIGDEQDGKGDNFSRPVLVLKKFNQNIFIAVPLSTKIKDNKFYHIVNFMGREQSLMLSQIRLMDAKRFGIRMGELSISEVNVIREKLKRLIF